MILDTKVVPNSKEQRVERQQDGSLKVWVREKPTGGKASAAAQRAIAKYLGLPDKRVEMSQTSSRKKKIRVNNINA